MPGKGSVPRRLTRGGAPDPGGAYAKSKSKSNADLNKVRTPLVVLFGLLLPGGDHICGTICGSHLCSLSAALC
eukprot:1194663-Prorocentrum_minimum.AAC.2